MKNGDAFSQFNLNARFNIVNKKTANRDSVHSITSEGGH